MVDSLALSRKTKLYNAVIAGVAMAGDEGQRSLLVLSDGADTTKRPLSEVLTAVEGGKVLVNVVSVSASDAPAGPLRELAEAGLGTVIDSNAHRSSETFSAEADNLARQVVVTATIPGLDHRDRGHGRGADPDHSTARCRLAPSPPWADQQHPRRAGHRRAEQRLVGARLDDVRRSGRPGSRV